MSTIRFEAKLLKVGDWTILRLPQSASAKLPSRGLNMVKGTINGFRFQTALEPDGKKSHWFKVDKTTLAPPARAGVSKAANATAGDIVSLSIESTKEYSEPEMPADLKGALAADPRARDLWVDITPMARWEWVRWIRATNRSETREKRTTVACSKLRGRMRRPCCFNSSMCTEPSVSKDGVLLDPT